MCLQIAWNLSGDHCRAGIDPVDGSSCGIVLFRRGGQLPSVVVVSKYNLKGEGLNTLGSPGI